MAAAEGAGGVRKFTLRSSDGEEVEVDEDVAMRSQTIRHMIEDGCAGDAIPLANVTGAILSKVIEYCRKHAQVEADHAAFFRSFVDSVDLEDQVFDEGLAAWDAEFVKVDQSTLFDLILAANYLDIKGLLGLTCQTVANMMKGKPVEEIRKIFHIINDYTPEEEEEVRRENQWAFE